VQIAATGESDPTGPYLPAAHKEPEHCEAPVSDAYVPAPHSTQLEATVAPTAAENLPATHSAQVEEAARDRQ
jgi:hypothetical protein